MTRLGWLYVASRRIPTAICLLAAIGAFLAVALSWRWTIAGGPAAQDLIPLTVETAAAAIIAVTTFDPFGEQEHATGRRLPSLRLTTTIVLTAAASAAVAAGALGGHLPGGDLAAARNLAGITGTGLLTAALLGGQFGWVGPFGYLLTTESALAAGWTLPWIWASRSGHDVGAGTCAALVFAAGALLITMRRRETRSTE
jgi:hypothetical protein